MKEYSEDQGMSLEWKNPALLKQPENEHKGKDHYVDKKKKQIGGGRAERSQNNIGGG